MSKKTTSAPVKKVVAKKPALEKPVQEEKQEVVESNPTNFVESLNLEELTPTELTQKIENDEQYEEVFTKLNELFLEYSNEMTVLDQKRQKVIDLMKSIHTEFKQKQGIGHDDEEVDEDIEDENAEEEEEEIQIKAPVKKVTQTATTSKKATSAKPIEPTVDETNENQEAEEEQAEEASKKPPVKKAQGGVKKAPVVAVPVKKAPVNTTKAASGTTTKKAPVTATAPKEVPVTTQKKPAVKKTGK
jgi:hypothetical protein